MELVASFLIHGTPISINRPRNLRAPWTQAIQNEARNHFQAPLDDDDLLIRIKYFYHGITRLDTDNISKPICDALNGIAYHDDQQIRNREVEKCPLTGAYRLPGVPQNVAIALTQGNDFVWVQLFKMGEGVHNLV